MARGVGVITYYVALYLCISQINDLSIILHIDLNIKVS